MFETYSIPFHIARRLSHHHKATLISAEKDRRLQPHNCYSDHPIYTQTSISCTKTCATLDHSVETVMAYQPSMATASHSSPSQSPRSKPVATAGNGANVPAYPLTNPAATNTTSQTPLTFVEPKRPSLNTLGNSDENTRKGSVQFLPQRHHITAAGDGSNSRSRSRKPAGEGSSRRLSSPPPPAYAPPSTQSNDARHLPFSPSSQFSNRVSFDTFDNQDASDFSLTLNRKHRDYAYTKRSRTFLCGTDANDYSDTALEWLIDELVDDGDEIVCLRVVEKDSREAVKWAGKGYSGGREGRERGYRAEASRMLNRIQDKNIEDKAINLVLEFSIGKVPDTIQHMVSQPLFSLIMPCMLCRTTADGSIY